MPRPSSASRWIGGGCRGSVALAARYPQTTGEDGENGTRLHGLAATALRGGPRVYNREDADVIDPYVFDVFREHWARPGSELLVERPVVWADDPRLGGTPDAVVLDGKHQHFIVWDLKTGWRLVEVLECWQLLCYAMMLAPPGWTMELRIVQPLPYHSDGAIRKWMLQPSVLARYAAKIVDAFTEAISPDAPLRPGGHCIYCEALAGCPAARAVTLGAVEYASREPVDLPDACVGRELQVLRETLKILQLRTDALEETTAARLRAGVPIPGVMMREGRGGRVNWAVDDASVRATLQVLTGMDPVMPKLLTPTQLRDSGVSREVLQPLTVYKPGKMVVSTDADNLARKTFGHEPNMEHVHPPAPKDAQV